MTTPTIGKQVLSTKEELLERLEEFKLHAQRMGLDGIALGIVQAKLVITHEFKEQGPAEIPEGYEINSTASQIEGHLVIQMKNPHPDFCPHCNGRGHRPVMYGIHVMLETCLFCQGRGRYNEGN